jgi:hypothetical protein
MVEATLASLQALKNANAESFKQAAQVAADKQQSEQKSSPETLTTKGWGATAHSALKSALNSRVGRKQTNSGNTQK